MADAAGEVKPRPTVTRLAWPCASCRSPGMFPEALRPAAASLWLRPPAAGQAPASPPART